MDRHPYRTAPDATQLPRPTSAIDRFEDRVVLALIVVVGALGIAIGLLSPDRTLEPSLGLVMLLFAAWTLARDLRQRSHPSSRGEDG